MPRRASVTPDKNRRETSLSTEHRAEFPWLKQDPAALGTEPRFSSPNSAGGGPHGRGGGNFHEAQPRALPRSREESLQMLRRCLTTSSALSVVRVAVQQGVARDIDDVHECECHKRADCQ